MLELPGDQNELIRRIVDANPNTIVVNNSGSPVAMPWLDEVPAVVQSWFAGQEFDFGGEGSLSTCARSKEVSAVIWRHVVRGLFYRFVF